MSSPIGSFFGGGGRAAKFPTVGDSITGVIDTVSAPEPQTDYESGQPIPGKMQIRITLQTTYRDATDPSDDGKRTLYVKGWMTGAVGDALRKAGVAEPKPSDTLTVTYTGDGTPTRPGLRGPKQYSATYEPAANFTWGGETVTPNGDAPPPGIDSAAWASMSDSTKAVIRRNTADQPPF